MRRLSRTKLIGVDAVYHVMSRTVGNTFLFKDAEKEVFRKMMWQVADFCGVEVLTYCVLSNHFHVLVRVPYLESVSDAELLRRFKVLYPKPTKYQVASFADIERLLLAGGADAAEVRQSLLSRMGDLSEFMKTLKQRFSIWYNRNHDQRVGTLWADRFKSVLVEGQGNALQTMAAYIDLNPVRAGIVEDPKDYRFCGYGEAVSGMKAAQSGLIRIWSDHGAKEVDSALGAHRLLIFGKHASEPGLSEMSRERALKVLDQENGQLPKAVMLRCRVRYFTDGAILGSAEYVQGFTEVWKAEHGRKHPPKVNRMCGSDWGGLAVIQSLRRAVFT
jgi:REP element-mobilizing transposase RayT